MCFWSFLQYFSISFIFERIVFSQAVQHSYLVKLWVHYLSYTSLPSTGCSMLLIKYIFVLKLHSNHSCKRTQLQWQHLFESGFIFILEDLSHHKFNLTTTRVIHELLICGSWHVEKEQVVITFWGTFWHYKMTNRYRLSFYIHNKYLVENSSWYSSHHAYSIMWYSDF